MGMAYGLRRVLAETGIPASALCDDIGVSQGHMSRLLSGRRGWTEDMMMRVFFWVRGRRPGTTLDELLLAERTEDPHGAEEEGRVRQ